MLCHSLSITNEHYAGYVKSSGICNSEKDMYKNGLAIYEKIYLKKFKNTELFIYGISLGTVCGLMLGLYLGKLCNGVILENSLFSINYLLKKSKISFLNTITSSNIRHDYCA